MAQPWSATVQAAQGELTGLDFPATVEALIAAGPAFLTEAFHASGALPRDNRVIAINGTQEFFGGGMGRKLKLDVTYENADPALHTKLFAKFTREIDDPLHGLFAPVMRPEVRFAMLSRREDFPIVVPTCYFGDYDPKMMAGLLITERVPYGEDGVEPPLEKCLDYLIDNPIEYYAAQAAATARLAAFHRSGQFGPEIEIGFPFDPVAAATTRLIPFTADQLQEKLGVLRAFVTEVPQLLPETLRDPAFLEPFCRDTMTVLEKELPILAHLAGQADLIALCHWNMNPDNAWFWRDDQGVLNSGQLDWGGVCQMNLAQSFFGMTCAAEADFLAEHEEHLMRLVLDHYNAAGGPIVDVQTFARSVQLSMAVLGTAWMLDAPSLIAAEIPDYRQLESRFDPRIRDLFIPRAQLQLMTVYLEEWRRLDIGRLIRAF